MTERASTAEERVKAVRVLLWKAGNEENFVSRVEAEGYGGHATLPLMVAEARDLAASLRRVAAELAPGEEG